jgi:hypothetical protein
MEKAKRARKAETLKQTKPFPKVARAVPLSRPWFEDHGFGNLTPQDQGHSDERDDQRLHLSRYGFLNIRRLLALYTPRCDAASVSATTPDDGPAEVAGRAHATPRSGGRGHLPRLRPA